MTACPVCGGARGYVFFATPTLPVVCNVFHADSAAARAVPRGRLELTWCPDCGMVFNRAFDPTLLAYDADYETSLHHSARFRDHAAQTVARLADAHRLAAARVVEIGCGRGEFLELFRPWARELIGFDRSHDGRDAPGITIHREYYDARRHGDLAADLVVCRHVLEHVVDPGALLEQLRGLLGPHGALYLEVPDARFTLRHGGVFDLIYEHCGYYTPAALEALCCRHGLAPLRIASEFDGQYLALDARAGSAPPELDPAEIAADVAEFAATFAARLATLATQVATALDAGRRVAVWGAGSKGVTMLNLLPRAHEITAVVDRHPGKHGRFVAGTGQPIVAPAALAAVGVDVVVVMNPTYRAEIERELRELGLAATCISAL